MQGRTYTVDFLGMQQINEDTGTARTVQRKVNPFFNARSNGKSIAVHYAFTHFFLPNLMA